MIDVIIAACGGALVAGLFSVLLWLLQRRAAKKDNADKAEDGTAAGVQILLYDRIKYLAKRHIAHGEIAAEDLEDIMRMHQIYHDELNGNGYLDSMMDAVKKLPIEKEI